MSALRELLDKYRSIALTERDKGTALERLIIAYIKNDAVQKDRFDDAWLYADWAKANGKSGNDFGIDVVAKIKGSDKFCAIQCKFYARDATIGKKDIDSFLAASGKSWFAERIFVDTTDKSWSKPAEDESNEQDKHCTRLNIIDLEKSDIDWQSFNPASPDVKIKPKKAPFQHQTEALEAVKKGLIDAAQNRGKVIMACGTGKTYTALLFAEDEELAGRGKRVLYLVPSLALMSQTIREWHNDAKIPLRSFAVCSDAQVGKRRCSENDISEISTLDLVLPATTDAKKLAYKASHNDETSLNVIFSTYQSINTINQAQQEYGLGDFDLIICDEAHRTTGAKLDGLDESNFTKIHDNQFIKGKKRIYMTATPRVYADSVKETAKNTNAVLFSMDSEEYYGKDLFVRGFGWAVENKLLTDYKVLVLAMDEGIVSKAVQKRLREGDELLNLDEATKIIGCYKALSKDKLTTELEIDPHPMRRALAFCKTINASKMVMKEFSEVVNEYLISEIGKDAMGAQPHLKCELKHVDGTMGAKERNSSLEWLKDKTDNSCRILTNAKCLSEGVDIPALDAILFMHPRKSQIEVVQSVGRVMRCADGKKMGYVILPVVIPEGVEPEVALKDNERYKVIWQVLNALRSHDERLDAKINQADLGVDISKFIEITAVTSQLPHKATAKRNADIGNSGANNGEYIEEIISTNLKQGEFVFDEFTKAIMAKIVMKCGKRDYWQNWASDIAEIAKKHITRIKSIISDKNSDEYHAFNDFIDEIHISINDSVSENEAIEMLAQHLITEPVFEALFEGHSFTKHNAVSKAMDNILAKLHEHNISKEAQSLDRFYEKVKIRAQGIYDVAAKQEIIKELYETFFKKAFPTLQDKMGIVYTPNQIVDFIIHSVNEVLQIEFNTNIGAKGVHILDPFTGTGTFITRLLQSGLISGQELEYKYENEIHANEIVLLTYYIAAVNIEQVYHSISGKYSEFKGICLTDTFEKYERGNDIIPGVMRDNNERIAEQNKTNIKVIISNPPYSAGQRNANDNAQNRSYPVLDEYIANTYVKYSEANLNNALYDSYIRAIKWASLRIDECFNDNNKDDVGGVLGFVTGAGWLEGRAMDGMRKCLNEEFSNLYIINLRGNIRKNIQTKGKAGEGDNVFGQQSMTPIAISIMVKKANSKGMGKIHYFDIGDDKTCEQKLKDLSELKSIEAISQCGNWEEIIPDKYNDWFGQRNPVFEEYICLGNRISNDSIFNIYSGGVSTSRDAWVFNYSDNILNDNIKKTIEFYNDALAKFKNSKESKADKFISNDKKSISWSRALRADFRNLKLLEYSKGTIVNALYRPFTSKKLYYSRQLNEMVLRMPAIFPPVSVYNRAIVTTGIGSYGFSCLMTDKIPCYDMLSKSQCYPLYFYEMSNNEGLFSISQDDKVSIRHDAVNDGIVVKFKSLYPNENITKEDIFFYVYGILHSEEYRERFANNLSKQLPRIPCVKKAEDFWAFTNAGRELGDMHVNYETYKQYPLEIKQGSLELAQIEDPVAYFRVEKMKYGKKNKVTDNSVIIYNDHITIQNIPSEAYDYVVNGKPAIDWVVDRQGVRTDKASGIVNDANDYANETMHNPKYPLELLARVIQISLDTMKIVRNLPKLDI